MRWYSFFHRIIAALGLASIATAADSFAWRDAETGFLFQQYNAAYAIGKYINFKIALPKLINTTYAVVMQVTAPIDVGWAGLAFGGSMTNNPLVASWANGASVTTSSRYAIGHSMPAVYPSATYTLFKISTKVNRTHWQYTAKCTGCTSYLGANNKAINLNPNGANRFAFAFGAAKPGTASNTSNFPVHDVTGYWNHDFMGAQNGDFDTLVEKGLGHS